MSGELTQSRVDPVFLEPGAYAVWGPSLRETMPTINTKLRGFPGGSVVENLPTNAGDAGLSPGPGRSHMPQSN